MHVLLRCTPAALAAALVLVLTACRGPERPADAVRAWPAGELRSGGEAVAATLGPGEVHRYALALEEGRLLRLVVDQQGIDVAVALEAPDGREVLAVDRPFDNRGPELVLAVTEAPGVHVLVVRGLETSVPGRYAARVESLAPATPADRRSAEAYRRFTAARSLPPERAEEALAERTWALAVWRELGDSALEAEALDRLARHYQLRYEWEPAAELYRQAAAAFQRAGDRRWEAIVRTSVAASLLPLAETEEAIAQAEAALALARRVDDRATQARALHNLGLAYRYQGELQQALDHYQQALPLWPESKAAPRSETLHNLGVLYSRFLQDRRRGRELLLAARDAWPPERERERVGNLNQLGRLAFEEGDFAEAREHLEAALALESGRCSRAVTLARLALVEDTEEAEGARRAADARLAAALEVFRERPCPTNEPTVCLLAAQLAEQRGDAAAARAGYRRCRGLFAELGDRAGAAESLAGIARGERALGDRAAALAASRQAVEIFEGVRPTVLSEELRTSYFSAAAAQFDLQIDLLLEQGDVAAAWATAEQARARALRDLLIEAGAGLRRGVDPALAANERKLQRRLNALESRRLEPSAAASREVLQRRIDRLVAELEAVRGEIRRRNPGYAALTRPAPISPAVIQRELLDGDTLLLEYRLGEEASTVWAVGRDTLTAVRLPPRREIEPAALEAARWLESLEWPGRQPSALCELSRLLLAPVGPLLGGRRLVVVADGALEGLSFAALPDPTAPGPCAEAPPLVAGHEVAYLPSAMALVTQRRLLAGRRPAPGWLAVVADPVYRPGDRSVPLFRRLPGAAREAAAIVAGLPAAKVFVATGAVASRQTVTGGALRGFRILHFATHGVLDAEQPLLSSLRLAQVDAAGRPVDGVLAAHEIYDLDLPAELVVLAACETARGRRVAGEGLVSGLPRAFVYAGAPRVLVSLWAIEDESTGDLMARLYPGLLDGLPPARALQEAQRALWREGRPPREWAGLVLLGDWRPLPPFSD